MKKFEYKRIQSLGRIEMDVLKLQGEQGWELVDSYRFDSGYSNYDYIFKREIEEE